MSLIALHLAAASSDVARSRVVSSWPWYLVRAGGFAAAALLILLMLSGIGQVTGLTYRLVEPVKAWVIHKALAYALCAAIAIHVGAILIDKFVSFSLVQVLVPFTATYQRVTLFGITSSWWEALGIFSLYAVVTIVISSLWLIERRKRMWKWLHYLSYLTMLAIFIHALQLGTDLKHGWVRTVWWALIALIIIAVLHRLRRVGTMRHRSSVPQIDKPPSEIVK